MITYNFNLPYYIELATKLEHCEHLGCFQHIKEKEMYYRVPTTICVKGKEVYQKLCVKCAQAFLKLKIKDLETKILDLKNELGKAEIALEEYRSDF